MSGLGILSLWLTLIMLPVARLDVGRVGYAKTQNSAITTNLRRWENEPLVCDVAEDKPAVLR